MQKLFLSALFCVCAVAQAQLFTAVAEGNQTASTQVKAMSAQDSSEFLRYFDATKDLQGSFIQTVYTQHGTEKSHGKMWISKPSKFYWDYQGANQQKIISNGTKVWQYDVDLEQISVRNRDELVGGVAMDILSGTKQLQALFAVSLVDKTQVPSMFQALNYDQAYRLTPLSEQDGYDAVWLVMKNHQLSALGIDAGRGQQTVIEFTQLQRNVGIPDSKFNFIPPAGVDVIGE